MIPLQQNIFDAVLPWIIRLDEREYIIIRVPISQVPGLDEATIRSYILNVDVEYAPGFVVLRGCLKSDELTQYLIDRARDLCKVQPDPALAPPPAEPDNFIRLV